MNSINISETQKLIQSHRSIRSFTGQAIDASLLNAILTSGIRAATSGNMQFYTIIVSQDAEQKEKLFHAHGKQKMILNASAILTFCADQRRLARWMKLDHTDYFANNAIGLFRGVVDACLVAQNVAIAAESEGLGTCYMGSTLNRMDEVSSVLHIPDRVMPVTSLVIGYPESFPQSSQIPRLPLEAIVHHEQYMDASPEKLKEFYKDKESDFWARIEKNPERKHELDKNKISSCAKAYVHMKYGKKALTNYSSKIEKFIEERWNMLIESKSS